MLNKLRNGLGMVLFIEKFCLTCVREARIALVRIVPLQ
jgi:hypothetical protein